MIRMNGGAFCSSFSALLSANSVLNSVESTFPAWLDSYMTAIDPLFPPPADFTKLPLTAVPPARVKLEKVSSFSSPNDIAPFETQPIPWDDDCRWAKLVETTRATAEDWYQDVRAIELEVEDVEESDRTRLCV
jgi:hypothetical protein